MAELRSAEAVLAMVVRFAIAAAPGPLAPTTQPAASSATPNAAALGIQQDLRMPREVMDLLMMWVSFRLWG